MSPAASGADVVARYTRHALWNALSLASRGIHVFPIGLTPQHETATGWKLEKVYYKGLAWSTEATTDPDRIVELWGDYPESAVGIATGPSRLAVVDVDELDAIPDTIAQADTFHYSTPRGGQHRLYRAPKSIQVKSVQPMEDTSGTTYPGIDIKAWGGMVVFYYPKRLKPADLERLDGLPKLPKPFRVPRGTTARTAEHAPLGDIERWIDEHLKDGDIPEALQPYVEAVPREGLSNGDLNAVFGPLVRAAWTSPGGRAAVLAGIERYADGYPHKYRRAALHSIESVARDYAAELASRTVFRLPQRDEEARPRKRKAKKGKGAKSANPHRLQHDEYTPTGYLDIIAPPTAPLDVAHEILTSNALPPLRYQREAWHSYQDGHWAPVDKSTVEDLLYAALHTARWEKIGQRGPVPVDWSPTHAKVREVLRAVQSLVTLPDRFDTGWLDGRDGPAHLVPARDGLLDPHTGELHPRSQHYFSLLHLDAKVGSDVGEPVEWYRFLDSLWPQADGSRELLQEWLGYVIAGDTRRHKGLLMIGPVRSGKGTLINVASALVGGEGRGMKPVSMTSFSQDFGLQGLESASLLALGDLRGSGRQAAQAAQALLEIIGGDAVSVNRKGIAALSIRPKARVMVGTNEMPRLYDDADAISTRFLILRMRRSFLNREDPDLFQRKILPELGAIARWAVEGYQRLERQGHFTVPETDAADRAAFRANSAPLTAFVDEMCVRDMDAPGSPVDDVWAAYRAWCVEANADEESRGTFSRMLAALGHGQHRPAGVDGDDTIRGKRRYAGLTLTEHASAEQRARASWYRGGGLNRPSEAPRYP